MIKSIGKLVLFLTIASGYAFAEEHADTLQSASAGEDFSYVATVFKVSKSGEVLADTLNTVQADLSAEGCDEKTNGKDPILVNACESYSLRFKVKQKSYEFPLSAHEALIFYNQSKAIEIINTETQDTVTLEAIDAGKKITLNNRPYLRMISVVKLQVGKSEAYDFAMQFDFPAGPNAARKI